MGQQGLFFIFVYNDPSFYRILDFHLQENFMTCTMNSVAHETLTMVFTAFFWLIVTSFMALLQKRLFLWRKFLPEVYKKVRDFQILSLEHINSAPGSSLFQYEFNRGVLEFLLAVKN